MSQFKFDFNQAAQETYQNHPELQKNTIFADRVAEEMIFPPKPDLLFRLKKEAVAELIKGRRSDGGGGCGMTHIYRYVALNRTQLESELGKYRFNLYSTDREKDIMGLFNHEVGHITVKRAGQGFSARIDKETRADLYAGLRYIQRFGKNDADAADLGFARLNDFLRYPDYTDYLTTFAVDKMKMDAQTADFISLTPQQTAALAAHYAEKYVPSRKDLNQLKQDFAPLLNEKRIYADSLYPLEKISNITLTAPVDSLTFYMGARALNGYMHLYQESLFNGKEGDKWRIIRTMLEERLDKSIHGETLRYFAENAAGIVDHIDPQPKAAAKHAPIQPITPQG